MLCISYIIANLAETKNKKKYLLYIILLWTFIAGVRAVDVGLDTKQYYKIFNLIATNDSQIWWYGIEASFVHIVEALLFVWNNTTVPFVFMAALTYALVLFRFWEFRNIGHFHWMVFCFFIMHYFASLNISRQFCAVAIIFWGTRYLCKRKYGVYLVTVLIGCLFHKSAVLGLLFYMFEFFYWKTLIIKQKLFIIAGLLALPICGCYILSNLSSYYKYLQLIEVDVGVVLPIKLLLFVVSQSGITSTVLRYYPNGDTIQQDEIRDLSIQIRKVRIYYLSGILMSFLGYFYSFVDRGALVLYIYEAVYFGIILKVRNDRSIFKLIVFSLFILIFIIGLIGDGHSVIPYRFIWQD